TRILQEWRKPRMQWYRGVCGHIGIDRSYCLFDRVADAGLLTLTAHRNRKGIGRILGERMKDRRLIAQCHLLKEFRAQLISGHADDSEPLAFVAHTNRLPKRILVPEIFTNERIIDHGHSLGLRPVLEAEHPATKKRLTENMEVVRSYRSLPH